MMQTIAQSVGRLLTLGRGARGPITDEDDLDGPDSKRDFALLGGFASYHVRIKDVKEYFQKQEMRRKRRLGLQLELIFLCFFFPLCVYWNAMFGQIDQAATILTTRKFPTIPITDNLIEHSAAMSSFVQGFANEEQFWQWINNVVYDEIFDKGQCGLAVGDGGAPRTAGSANTQIPIIAGQVRLRQVRVEPQTCPLAASLMNITCYPAFEEDVESTRPIPSLLNLTDSYEYRTAAATTEQSYEGEFATYPGSGFTINLTTGVPPGNYCDPNFNVQALQLLFARATPFVDPSTRALVLTVTTFSPDTGALATTRLMTEVSFSGTFHTSMKNQGVIYFRTASSWLTMQILTVFVVVIECVFVISSLWGLVFGWEVESVSWMVLDLVTSALMIYQMYLLISLFFVSSFFDSFQNSINSSRLFGAQWAGSGFYSGSSLSLLETTQGTNSVIFLISAVRIFRYSQYLDAMSTIHDAIRHTWRDIIMYFVLLCLLSLGYVLCGMVVLSGYLPAWSSYSHGIFTLTQYFVLIVDYYSMQSIEPFGIYIAPIFLVTFIFIFTWYMFAVFLAVIYVGYRVERTINEQKQQKRKEWERSAEENGALCISATVGENVKNDEDEEVVVQGAEQSFFQQLYDKTGILAKKSFFYSSNRSTIYEYLRMFVGLPERSGFRDYNSIVKCLKDYEDKWLKQNLPNFPAKRYLVSFGELMDIINGNTVDLIEELRKISNNATAAEEYRRYRSTRLDQNDQRVAKRFEGPGDSYLTKMNPLEIQLARLFRTLWIIPEEKLEFFARLETDDPAGQMKRILLVRIQEAMRTLDDRETESVRMVAAKIQSLRVVQQTMERDMKALRNLLK